MRTTVSIDDRLLDAAKATARDAGLTLGQFVEDALRARLSSPVSPAPVPRVPVFTGGSGFAPGIDPASNRSLFDALDDAGDLG